MEVPSSNPVTGSRRGLESGAENRLVAVDGLRAFAAVWVVLFHVHLVSGASFGSVPLLDLFWSSGWTGVSLFLVVSGFCLYLPYAGGRQGRFAAGEFLKRRAWRLLPAYYASLAVVIPLHILVARSLGGASGLTISATLWHGALHAAMLHLFVPDAFYSLNGVYWSLALEWEWYAALPLAVLAAARWGVFRTAVAAIAINLVYSGLLLVAQYLNWLPNTGLLTGAVLPNQLYGRLAEFALGIVAAELYVSGRLGWAHRVRHLAPLLFPAVLIACKLPLSSVSFGAVFFVLLCIVLSGDGYVARAFGARPVVALGLMSYSIYLVHHPMLQVLGGLSRKFLHVPPTTEFFVLLAAVPFILLAAWVFFLVAERPTLSSRYRLDQMYAGEMLLPDRWISRLRRIVSSPRLEPEAATAD